MEFMTQLGNMFKSMSPQEQQSLDARAEEMKASGMTEDEVLEKLGEEIAPDAIQRDRQKIIDEQKAGGNRALELTGLIGGGLKDLAAGWTGKSAHTNKNLEGAYATMLEKREKPVKEMEKQKQEIRDYLEQKKKDKKDQATELRAVKKEGREQEMHGVKMEEARIANEKYLRQKDLERQADDPNSPLSQTYQQLAATFDEGGTIPLEGRSATELMDIIPALKDKYTAEQNRIDKIANRQMAEARLQQSKDATAGVQLRSEQAVQKNLSDALEPNQGVMISLGQIEDNMGMSLEEYVDAVDAYKRGEGPEPDAPGFSFLGRWALPFSKGKISQGLIQDLMNVKLKQQSGAAVSDQEFQRFKTAMNSGRLNTEYDLMKALLALKRGTAEGMRSIEARVSKGYEGVIDDYNKAGGVTSRRYEHLLRPESQDVRGQSTNTATGGGQVQMVSPDGKVYTVSEGEVKDAEAHGWRVK